MMDTQQAREILGVSQTSSAEDIRQAYFDLVKVWHPDRFAQDPKLAKKAQEKMQMINLAFDYLSNPNAQKQPRAATSTASYNSNKATPKAKHPHKPYIIRDTPWIFALIAMLGFLVVSYIFKAYGTSSSKAPTKAQFTHLT